MKYFSKIFILTIIVVSGLYISFQLFSKPQSIEQTQFSTEQVSQKIQVSLKIDFGNNLVKNFSDLTVESSSTVFDLLKKATAENNITLKYKDYGGEMGVFVEVIGDNTNDLAGNKYWQFWINGEYAKIGPSGTKLKNGDAVEWKFTEGQF